MLLLLIEHALIDCNTLAHKSSKISTPVSLICASFMWREEVSKENDKQSLKLNVRGHAEVKKSLPDKISDSQIAKKWPVHLSRETIKMYRII